MQRRIRQIMVMLMVMIFISTSLFTVLSHLLCEKCSDSHSHISITNDINTTCCSSCMNNSDLTNNAKEKEDKEKSNTCPCCNQIFEDLLSENDIQKQNFINSAYLKISILSVIYNEILFNDNTEDICYFIPLKTPPLSGRNILAFHSVLII